MQVSGSRVHGRYEIWEFSDIYVGNLCRLLWDTPGLSFLIPLTWFTFSLADLKKTLAVLLDNIMLRLGKLESKVENIYNGTGGNLTNGTSTATPSATNAEKVNVAGMCCLSFFLSFCFWIVCAHVGEGRKSCEDLYTSRPRGSWFSEKRRKQSRLSPNSSSLKKLASKVFSPRELWVIHGQGCTVSPSMEQKHCCRGYENACWPYSSWDQLKKWR